MPSNAEFLTALFGDDARWAHVTDFGYDPSRIPAEKHLAAWKGDYFSRYRFGESTNQYFTVSTFYADEKGVARRRKALFRATHVIVLDDVREKLPIEQVNLLPQPSWILETSAGSEQWGYILTEPCTGRARVENLLDGLVERGLAPDGKDPGMKGVTRYVRLPNGINNKANKLVNGQPFKCRLLRWEPFIRVTLEDLAAPFAVDLDRPRREGRIDGAAAVEDHPLLQVPDLVHIKEVRSDGRFDVTCPWVEGHTDRDDSGAAIFTNADGSIGFKCHHGSCQHRTGRHLLQFIEEQIPGFTAGLTGWRFQRDMQAIVPPAAAVPAPPPAAPAPTPPASPQDSLAAAFCTLRSTDPFSQEAREIAGKLLQAVDQLPAMDKTHWQNEIRDVMRWTRSEFKTILQGLREEWYISKSSNLNFFDEVVFVAEQNQFFDRKKRIFYSAEAYQNTYAHLDPEARKQALQGGYVTKVDKLDYAPLMPPVFSEGGVTYANSWTAEHEVEGVPGDVSWYLQHFDHLGWGPYRKHFLQYLAFTLRHPDVKINHMMILGSTEGTGKDWLLYPINKAMGENGCIISGEDLLSDFHDHLLTTKWLHINETELGDRREAIAIGAKLKPLAAAPPFKLRVNQKNIKPIWVRNIVNGVMTTNSQLPFRLNGESRRFFALWTHLNPRGADGNVQPEWAAYWRQRWQWMTNGGAEAVIHYLRHQVDLSDFDPGVAPPVTDFLRDMVEASKSAAQLTLEACIREREGPFVMDLMTPQDIANGVRVLAVKRNDLMYTEQSSFSVVKVGATMRDITGSVQLRAENHLGEQFRVWCVRNVEHYRAMSPAQIYAEYARQTHSPHLQVVNQ